MYLNYITHFIKTILVLSVGAYLWFIFNGVLEFFLAVIFIAILELINYIMEETGFNDRIREDKL